MTVAFIKDGIGKLRAVEAANDAGAVDLWRGMRNLSVGQDFMEVGGTELAPMSTTNDLRVAMTYAMASESLLFKLRTDSFMQRGADLSYLSAFPAEREILYPPLTFLKPTGRTQRLRCKHGEAVFTFDVVEVVPAFPS